MLKILKGDLFNNAKAPCIIAHGCNAQGVMSAGFAKKIKELYPENFDVYLAAFKTSQYGELETGSNIYFNHSSGIVICNCITQRDYGSSRRYLNYWSLERCMSELEDSAHAWSLPVHMPLIGTGYAGGDPEIVMRILEKSFRTATEATVWTL